MANWPWCASCAQASSPSSTEDPKGAGRHAQALLDYCLASAPSSYVCSSYCCLLAREGLASPDRHVALAATGLLRRLVATHLASR